MPVPEVGGLEGPESGFQKLVDGLNAAQSVVGVGQATVDDERTVEFEAKLNPRRVLRGSFSHASRRKRRQLRHAKVTLDLYLASNGLPVRTRFDVRLGQVSLTAALDLFATEIPVSVQPPPASETVTEAELKGQEGSGGGQLEVESHPLTKREKAEEKRFWRCMKRRLPKHHRRVSPRRFVKAAHQCRRRAKLRSHSGGRPVRQSKQ